MIDTTTRRAAGYAPDYAIAPGQTLADLLDELGMSQTDLAHRLGVSLKHVNQVANGAASISSELALGLEKVFGVPATFWINRESLYRADLARREEREVLSKAIEWARRFPISELKRRKFIPRHAEGPDLVLSLLEFLGIAGPKQWSDPRVAFRKSVKFESDPYALSAWLRVGELEAADIECKSYSADKFVTALQLARQLTRLDPSAWHPQLIAACAQAGVAVVIVDTFSGARANGASRWLGPGKAVIQLSLRHKWEDIFWFTFFHEAGHVLLHRKKDVFVDVPGEGQHLSSDAAQNEREADRFATRTLIPSAFETQLASMELAEIRQFADQLGIAPAIVVGRLQHEGKLLYNQGNGLRRRFVFAST
jgi:HTH-type transcriptional regulator/antitoxin HigA